MKKKSFKFIYDSVLAVTGWTFAETVTGYIFLTFGRNLGLFINSSLILALFIVAVVLTYVRRDEC